MGKSSSSNEDKQRVKFLEAENALKKDFEQKIRDIKMNHQYEIDKLKQQGNSSSDELRGKYEKQINELNQSIKELNEKNEKHLKSLEGDSKSKESDLRKVRKTYHNYSFNRRN